MGKLKNKAENVQQVNAIASLSVYQCYFRPDGMAFNADLREFAQRVSHLRELETKGEISGVESSLEIKRLWKQSKQKKENCSL